MATILREKKIKSADRVLEILEMFDETRSSVTVMDVARCLQYPQSSTSELLGSLVKHGYLTRDRFLRTYRPTARVALLGAWVQPQLFRDGRLLPMMDELHDDSGEIVVLASTVDVTLKHLHTVGETSPSLRAGSAHHILHSPLGRTLLSMTEREYVRKIVHRLNAESDEDRRVRYPDLSANLDAIRSKGFAVGPVDADRSCVCVLLPQTGDQEKLALGLIVRTTDLDARLDELVRLVRGAVASHLGPTMTRLSAMAAPAYALAS